MLVLFALVDVLVGVHNGHPARGLPVEALERVVRKFAVVSEVVHKLAAVVSERVRKCVVEWVVEGVVHKLEA